MGERKTLLFGGLIMASIACRGLWTATPVIEEKQAARLESLPAIAVSTSYHIASRLSKWTDNSSQFEQFQNTIAAFNKEVGVSGILVHISRGDELWWSHMIAGGLDTNAQRIKGIKQGVHRNIFDSLFKNLCRTMQMYGAKSRAGGPLPSDAVVLFGIGDECTLGLSDDQACGRRGDGVIAGLGSEGDLGDDVISKRKPLTSFVPVVGYADAPDACPLQIAARSYDWFWPQQNFDPAASAGWRVQPMRNANGKRDDTKKEVHATLNAKFYWRGTPGSPCRCKIVLASLSAPGLIDARFAYKSSSRFAKLVGSRRSTYKNLQTLRTSVRNNCGALMVASLNGGLVRDAEHITDVELDVLIDPEVSTMHEYVRKSQFLLDVQGYGTTFRLKNLMLSGATVVKVEHVGKPFRQWWEHLVTPGLHYLEASCDHLPEDLESIRARAVANPSWLRQIGKAGSDFIARNLTSTTAHLVLAETIRQLALKISESPPRDVVVAGSLHKFEC